jgi:hypothetical protein
MLSVGSVGKIEHYEKIKGDDHVIIPQSIIKFTYTCYTRLAGIKPAALRGLPSRCSGACNRSRGYRAVF